MTTPTRAKRNAPVIWRIVVGVVGVFALMIGIRQLLHGTSEMKGGAQTADFAAIARRSLEATTPFQSRDGEFQLQYPESWDLVPKPPFKFHAMTLSGIVSANVNVETVAPGTTFDNYIEYSFAGLAKAGIKVKPPTHRTPATVSGLPAVRLSILATMPESMHLPEDVYFDMLIVLAHDKAYVLTCTTANRGAAAMKPVFDRLMSSLEIEKAP